MGQGASPLSLVLQHAQSVQSEALPQLPVLSAANYVPLDSIPQLKALTGAYRALLEPSRARVQARVPLALLVLSLQQALPVPVNCVQRVATAPLLADPSVHRVR